VDDRDLLNFEVSTLDIVVTNKAYHGKTIKDIAEMEMGRPGRGVYLRKMIRGGRRCPLSPGMVVERGDTLSVVGATKDVERAAKLIGYADRVTEKTDMMFMGFRHRPRCARRRDHHSFRRHPDQP
jgi:putative transport protein